MDDIAENLSPAVAHRDAGRYDEARSWLDRQIADRSGDVEAEALLVQIHILRKDIGAAEEAMARVQTLDAAHPSVLRSAARLLIAQGRGAEALGIAQRAWQAAPENPESCYVLAVSLCANRQDDDALPLLNQALATRFDFAEALALRALIRSRRGEIATARADAEAAFSLKPFLPQFGALVSTMRHASGDHDGAIVALQDAQKLDPDNVGYRVTLGEYLRQADRADEAIPLLTRATELAPLNATAWANLGTALQHAKRNDAARAAYRQALAIDPQLAQIANNLGGLAREAADWEAALRHFNQAIAAKPGFADAITNRATALMNLGRLGEAGADYRSALALQPDLAEARWSKGAFDLLHGELEAGWQGYEWRWKMERISTPRRHFTAPLWTGAEPIEGRRILVHWEQGLGDTIQFSRYGSLLAERGAHVLFAPQPKLRRLMEGLDGGITLVHVDDPALDFDVHIPLLSLPWAFGTRIDTIPARKRYLAAERTRVEFWHSRIGGDGFRIGICWQGGPTATAIPRSFPLAMFATIAAMPGVRLISLQKDADGESFAPIPKVERLGADFDTGADAFVDSAAVIAQCDLVISCDTAIGHLAGALGVPTWLALKQVPDWRWMLGRSDSPWYPSVRLFRQPVQGDWISVFREMETALRVAREAV